MRYYLIEHNNIFHINNSDDLKSLCKLLQFSKDDVYGEYPYTIEEIRKEAAHLCNKGLNICPDCICELYHCKG